MSLTLKRSSFILVNAILLVSFQNCGGYQTMGVEEASLTPVAQSSGTNVMNGGASGSSAPTPTPTVSLPKTCKPLRKFTYTQTNAFSLQCSPGNNDTVVFEVQVPAEGRAFSRAQFDIGNFAPAGDPIVGVHSWAGSGATGDSSFAKRFGGGAGQSICPGQYAQGQQILSYGMLNANSKTVRVQLRQYTSSGCTNGSLIVQPGAKLEVWVEDPDCEGSSIAAGSYFRDIRSKTGSETPFALTTSTQDVLSMNITLPEPKTALIYGQVEASMPSTANRCGGQYETAAAIVGVNGSYLGSSSVGGWPVSGGETHIALYPAGSKTLSAGSHRIHLAAAVNQGINSGRAKAGLDHSGDTMIGVILNHGSAVEATPVTFGKTQKILTLGDSITLGYEDTSSDARSGAGGGYRYFLYHHLNNRGFKVDFVGSQSAGPSDLPQKNHQGHAGWKIEDIATGIVQYSWVKNTKPDVILLHIGTNDFFTHNDVQNNSGHVAYLQGAATRLSQLLDQIYTDAPTAKIVVAKIVPMPVYAHLNAYVADYNNSVGLVVAQKQSLGRQVYVVDMNSALSNVQGSADFCQDQAHPSRQGYAKMADVWISTLVQLF